MFMAAAVVIGAGAFLRGYGQTMTGELTSAVVRDRVFSAFMRQDIGFYDRKENAVGSLTTTLSNDAALLPGIGNQISAVFQVGFTFVASFLLAIVLGNWKMTLACMVMMPVLAGAILGQQIITFRTFKRKRESLIKAAVLPTQVRLSLSLSLFLSSFLSLQTRPWLTPSHSLSLSLSLSLARSPASLLLHRPLARSAPAAPSD